MTEFVEWLTGTHTCNCGAKYKVTVTEAHLERVNCEKCGVVMDHPTDKSFLLTNAYRGTNDSQTAKGHPVKTAPFSAWPV